MKKSTKIGMFTLGMVTATSVLMTACTAGGTIDPGAIATAQAVAAAAQTQAAASGLDLAVAQQTAQAAIVQGQQVLADAQATQAAAAAQMAATPVPAELYTTPHPILGDIRVRQAIAYCTDRPSLIKSVYPLLTEEQQAGLAMNTFIPRDHWAYAGDDNVTVYEFDAEKGAALLDEAGWTQAEEGAIRTDADGNELALKFTTTSATFRQTWAAVFEQQMAACGIRVLRLHVPAAWWFGDTTGLARRDYELGAFAWVGQADPGGVSLYACNQIPKPENGWEGQGMGWCNETASQAIIAANNTLAREDRIKEYAIAQVEFAKDMVSLPLFNRTNVYAANPKLVGLAPAPGESYYMHNIEEWELPGSDTIVMGFTQEPASLFTQNEDAFVAQAVASMIGGFFTTGLNYDFQAKLQSELSTIELGLAKNDVVEVKAGDMVYDVNGDVVELAAGVKVKDADGNDVEYADGTVNMPQLTVTYSVVDGLKWSDGTEVTQADFELAYKVRCDTESGATSYVICDQTANIEFTGTGYTVTYQPGVQSPTYFLMPYGIAPAHQETSDGRKLADVPPAEWATLPEVAEMPLGVGPYVIKNWEKGVQIELEANPYYDYGFGAPKTENVVISFVSPDNAEAQLLGGQVDVLGNETLTALTESLDEAAKAGKIVVIVDPSATWEHIDMQLFLK